MHHQLVSVCTSQRQEGPPEIVSSVLNKQVDIDNGYTYCTVVSRTYHHAPLPAIHTGMWYQHHT